MKPGSEWEKEMEPSIEAQYKNDHAENDATLELSYWISEKYSLFLNQKL